MKMINMFLVISLFVFQQCSFQYINTEPSNYPHPVADEYVGNVAMDIIQKFGKPQQTKLLHVDSMIDEIRSEVKKRITDSTTKQIKEYFYKTESGRHFFWLKRNETDMWIVIADLFVPNEVTI